MSPEVASRVIALFRDVPAAGARRAPPHAARSAAPRHARRGSQLQDGRRRARQQRQHRRVPHEAHLRQAAGPLQVRSGRQGAPRPHRSIARTYAIGGLSWVGGDRALHADGWRRANQPPCAAVLLLLVGALSKPSSSLGGLVPGCAHETLSASCREGADHSLASVVDTPPALNGGEDRWESLGRGRDGGAQQIGDHHDRRWTRRRGIVVTYCGTRGEGTTSRNPRVDCQSHFGHRWLTMYACRSR